MKTAHIIYIIDDGITSLRCGVGAIGSHFVSAFPDIAKQLLKNGICLKLSVISIKPHGSSVGIRDDLLKKTKKICINSGGNVYLLQPKIKPKENYFNFKVWKTYNTEANEIVDQIINSSDFKTIVITNDTIFAHVYSQKSNPINIWIPNSFSMIHEQSYVNGSIRLDWEKERINLIKDNPGCYLGCVSPFIKSSMKKTFGLGSDKLPLFGNSFYLPSFKKYCYSEDQIEKVLNQRGIPTNRDIIFSFGRADEYKGIDISLKSIMKIVKKYDFYGVVIASKFSKEPIVERVQKKLLRIAKSEKLPISIFFGYEFELPKYILRYRRTKYLFNLPTRDFCPLIPFEADILGHDELCVINSNLDCFRGLIRDNQDGFLVEPVVKDVVLKFEKIMSMTNRRRNNIILNGKKRSMQKYDIVKNYATPIKYLLKNNS